MDEAKSAALKLVLTKRRTEKEVVEKLKAKGFSTEDAISAASYYREAGYIDHHEYALRFSHDAAYIKGFGPLRIRRDLLSRGIEEIFISDALATISFDVKDAMQMKYGSGQKSEKELFQIYQYYARKGFAPECIRDALRALFTYE